MVLLLEEEFPCQLVLSFLVSLQNHLSLFTQCLFFYNNLEVSQIDIPENFKINHHVFSYVLYLLRGFIFRSKVKRERKKNRLLKIEKRLEKEKKKEEWSQFAHWSRKKLYVNKNKNVTATICY